MAETKANPVTVKTDTAEVTVHPFGAHVTSWKVDGEEIMFVSSLAKYDGSRPIRGGVPICFPQFGPGPIKQHGFARRSYWNFVKSEVSEDGKVGTIQFSLSPTEYTLEMWNHKFELLYTVIIQGAQIQIDLVVKNTEESAWSFTGCLHTYFGVEDITKTQILGLKGTTYLDSLKDRAECTEENEGVTFNQNVDRIYRKIDWPVSFNNGKKNVKLTTNVADCVVWNPWSEKAQAMGDFEDSEYLKMVCVEPAQAIDPIEVASGAEYTFTHTISVE